MSDKNKLGFLRMFFRSFGTAVLTLLLIDLILREKAIIDRRSIIIALACSLFNAYYNYVVFKKSDTKAVRALKITGLCAGVSLIAYGISLLLYSGYRSLSIWILIVIPVGQTLCGVLVAFLILKFVNAYERHALEDINEMLKKNGGQGREDDKSKT